MFERSTEVMWVIAALCGPGVSSASIIREIALIVWTLALHRYTESEAM